MAAGKINQLNAGQRWLAVFADFIQAVCKPKEGGSPSELPIRALLGEAWPAQAVTAKKILGVAACFLFFRFGLEGPTGSEGFWAGGAMAKGILQTLSLHDLQR